MKEQRRQVGRHYHHWVSIGGIDGIRTLNLRRTFQPRSIAYHHQVSQLLWGGQSQQWSTRNHEEDQKQRDLRRGGGFTYLIQCSQEGAAHETKEHDWHIIVGEDMLLVGLPGLSGLGLLLLALGWRSG